MLADAILEHFSTPPTRVVSLVPSITESLFDLGAGGHVVGITDYCIHPAAQLDGLPNIGGTKDPNIEAILRLSPDLVIANKEENPRKVVEAVRAAGVPVFVTFPTTVRETLQLLFTLAGLFKTSEAYLRLETLERSVEWAEADQQSRDRLRYFCPIWKSSHDEEGQWWMTFNEETYPHDLLSLLGGTNIFSARKRHYPLKADLGGMAPEPLKGRDARYPRVTLQEIFTRKPDVILLPNEPYGFQEEDVEALGRLLEQEGSGTTPRFILVDGSWLFWHGTRLGLALQHLGDLFSNDQN